MTSKPPCSLDKSFMNFIRAQANKDLSKADKLRHEISQMGAQKEQCKCSNKEFHQVKYELMQQYCKENQESDLFETAYGSIKKKINVAEKKNFESKLVKLNSSQFVNKFNLNNQNVIEPKNTASKNINLKNRANESELISKFKEDQKEGNQDFKMTDKQRKTEPKIQSKIDSFFQSKNGTNIKTKNISSSPKKMRNEISPFKRTTLETSEMPSNKKSKSDEEAINKGDAINKGEAVNKGNLIDEMKPKTIFKTGLQQLASDLLRKGGNLEPLQRNYGLSKKQLGMTNRVNSSFQPPFKQQKENKEDEVSDETKSLCLQNESLKNIDPKMVELIQNEIIDNGQKLQWDDIAGLEFAKKKIEEIVVWPLLRPDIFKGIRKPPKGLLLFGPPGTGKTLIGKCIASQSNSTFFSISASTLTSKWIGEGEKMVRAMFAVARSLQPSVIFIDEVDSLLTQRNETEHESSRRLKTEFLVQFEGVGTLDEERILVIGATNRPSELDEAARRRFASRLYIPLPEGSARIQIMKNCLKNVNYLLDDKQFNDLANKTDGYSGSDMTHLCREASLGPLRRNPNKFNIQEISLSDIESISFDDFIAALESVKPSVAEKDLTAYIEFNEKFGINCSRK